MRRVPEFLHLNESMLRFALAVNAVKNSTRLRIKQDLISFLWEFFFRFSGIDLSVGNREISGVLEISIGYTCVCVYPNLQ